MLCGCWLFHQCVSWFTLDLSLYNEYCNLARNLFMMECNRKDVSGAQHIEDLYNDVVTTHVRCGVLCLRFEKNVWSWSCNFIFIRDPRRIWRNHARRGWNRAWFEELMVFISLWICKVKKETNVMMDVENCSAFSLKTWHKGFKRLFSLWMLPMIHGRLVSRTRISF